MSPKPNKDTQRSPAIPETGAVPGDTLQPPPQPTGQPSDEPPSVVGEIVLQAGARPVPGYELVKRLGSGGFGEVWKAVGPGGFEVALKFLRLDARSGASELRSLALMKDIRHPHLLAMFGNWQVANWLVIAMELGDCTLEQRLNEAKDENQPGIPLLELLEYMREAAKGIDHLNELGIQHRDIKPQNFLLVGGGLKVADFGLAKILENSFASNSGAMTPGYAAPEFFQGQTSPFSDQYSFGITYCYLRGGRLPFEGNAMQVMFAHLQEDPDLSMIAEKERPAVQRALSKRAEDRWPSCRAFVNGLYKACGLHDSSLSEGDAGGTKKQKTSPPMIPLTLLDPKPTDWPRQSSDRRPRRRVLLALLLLLVAGLAGAGVVYRDTILEWIGPGEATVAQRENSAEPAPPPELKNTKTDVAMADGKAPIAAERTPPAGTGAKSEPKNPDRPAKVENRSPPIKKEKPPQKIPPKPQPVALLKVQLPREEVEIGTGRTIQVPIRVKRENFTEPVEFKLSDLPDGVTPRIEQDPADRDQATLHLQARPTTPPGAAMVTLTASGGGLTNSARFRLNVKREAAPEQIVNAVGMKLVLIHPGTFRRGSPAEEPGRGADEGPARDIRISKPYYLGAYEVTQEQFARVMSQQPSWFQDGGDGGDIVRGQDTRRLPVEMVSWQQAVDFCRRLSELPEEKDAGRAYRLPTEAEWEYACRAGTTSAYAVGAVLGSTQAHIGGKVPALGPKSTTAVGSYGPNPWGLFDMHGNVYEWCSDWYDPAFYAAGPATDPQGPEKGTSKVIRGGSWGHTARNARSAARNSLAPTVRNFFTGFRVAVPVSP